MLKAFIKWIKGFFVNSSQLKKITISTTTDNYGRVLIPENHLREMGYTGNRFSLLNRPELEDEGFVTIVQSQTTSGVLIRRNNLFIRTGYISYYVNVEICKHCIFVTSKGRIGED